MKKISAFLIASVVLMNGCGVQIKPLQKAGEVSLPTQPVSTTLSDSVAAVFFADGYGPADAEYYTYPDDISKLYTLSRVGKVNDQILVMDIFANDYSGAAFYFDGTLFDLSPYYDRGTLDFWVKTDSASEGAKCFVELADDDKCDGLSTEVKLPLNNYVDPSQEWKHVSIPLHDFGRRGSAWNNFSMTEAPRAFQWDKVNNFTVSVDKGVNKKCLLMFDDIKVMKNRCEPAPEHVYWDEIQETVPAPPAKKPVDIKVAKTFFKDDIPFGGYTEVYGGRTAVKVQPTTSYSNKGVLAVYLDNNDWSGASLALGAKKFDVRKLREGRGAFAFWAKFTSLDVHKVILSLQTDYGTVNHEQIQSSVSISDFGGIDTAWKYYVIPLKYFSNHGSWWSEAGQTDVPIAMDWSRINEISLAIDKCDNRVDPAKPLTIYFDDIDFLEDSPGWVDPHDKWNNFSSTDPDTTIIDFETEEQRGMDPVFGDYSDVCLYYPGDRFDTKRFGDYVMKVDYKLGLSDWVDIPFDFEVLSYSEKARDWSKYWGVKVSLMSPDPTQRITACITDSSGEVWCATTRPLGEGWQDITIPFKDFEKRYTDQPAGLNEDGRFDLESVRSVSFIPAFPLAPVEVKGTFYMDNVTLTNKK